MDTPFCFSAVGWSVTTLSRSLYVNLVQDIRQQVKLQLSLIKYFKIKVVIPDRIRNGVIQINFTFIPKRDIKTKVN